MLLKSYAKINLTLLINRKLNNGMHKIQSFFCLINLFDKIFIKKINKKKDTISFTGPYSKNVKKDNNSIHNLLEVMRKNKILSNYYLIKIHKNIPVFSGFGGGTSNAATILDYLINKKAKKNIFDKITKKVGSDLRLFNQKQGYLKDLKTVVKFRTKHQLHFLIVYPRIKCSTKEIYSKVKIYNEAEKFLARDLRIKRKFINYIKNSKNDLQSIVEKKHPVIKRLISSIQRARGCYFARLTGSGSACYGLFINENCAKAALSIIRKKYPKFWLSIAKTI
tara:strand:- start:3799 stop:4635 length:837 start_codon:yes stop_codon:yes gene_type:complete